MKDTHAAYPTLQHHPYTKIGIRGNLLKIFIFVAVTLLLPSSMWSKEYTPEMVPNVNIADRTQYVSDPEGMMSPTAREAANRRIKTLRDSLSVEMAVVLVPTIGDIPIEEWSEQLFTKWGIGKSDKDNGLLLVIARDDRKARIQTGYGMEGVITDFVAKQIITNQIAPAMRQGDIDSAINNSVGELISIMSNPEYAAELRSKEKDNYNNGGLKALDSSVFWGFIQMVAAMCFAASLGMFIYTLAKGRKLDLYQKSLLWRGSIKTFVILAVLSLGSGTLFLALAALLYRHCRTKRRICSTCGHKMNRLPEDKDNQLLSPSQDLEEQLDTIDYDVWECPECGTIDRYPFKTKQLRYTECPVCHTVALGLADDRVVVRPTYRSEGRGEKIYECKFCHNKHVVPYVIPKKERPPVILPIGGGGSGSGGGGGFGGGFGGGSTGGGGASGGW